MLDIRRLSVLEPSVELEVLLELFGMIATHDGALRAGVDFSKSMVMDYDFCEHDVCIIKTRIKELFEKRN